MTQLQKWIIALLLSIGLLLGTIVSYENNKEPEVKTKVVYKDRLVKPKGVYVTISKTTLEKDILRYKNISNKTRQLVLSNIIKYSKQYKINPIQIYSLIATESSFKYWIKHSIVNIVINKHKMQTRAIGLGAVIYEWWKPKLEDANITQVKSDLYNIATNIQATCFIYSKLRDMPLMKGTTNKEDSAKLRYFGGGAKNKWYVIKINKVMSNLLKQELK